MKIPLEQSWYVDPSEQKCFNFGTRAFTESSRFPYLTRQSRGASEGQMTQIWRHSVAGLGSWKCQHTFLGEDKMQRRKSQKKRRDFFKCCCSFWISMTSCGLKVANISAVSGEDTKGSKPEDVTPQRPRAQSPLWCSTDIWVFASAPSASF